ncbi:hypothetical protein [Clostridium thermobutyricum]|uniref:hypothetical protein n=1 Tax=Clostridium thermobutyricum TaxID=29372 RepID=UPI0018AC4A6C|nr:hypothetical protein [Clostridium thermobutyricum]
MKFNKLKYFKYLLILLVVILCFTLFIFFINSKKTISTYSSVDINKKHLIDLTGDGVNETIEVIQSDNSYDVKITTQKSTILLSSLLEDNFLCSNGEGNIFKLRFINISRDNKPEILIQGIKNNSTINYLFSYNNNFELTLQNSNNVCGVIDSNLNKTPQFISLNYNKNKENIRSNMIINNELINSTRDSLVVPGIDSIIPLINYINLDVEVESHPDVFTDSISSKDLSNLWKLDKSNFSYKLIDGFFFDTEIDDNGDITECNYTLYFNRKNLKDNTIEPFNVEVTLNKDYYNNTLRISKMNFFFNKK